MSRLAWITALLLLVFPLAACDRAPGGDDASAGSTSSPTGVIGGGVAEAPAIRFESDRVDFGEVWSVGSYRHTFRFRNSGRATLEIIDIKAGCGCTVPLLTKKSFEPGEEGTFEVMFNPKSLGAMTKELTVITNSPTTPTVQLLVMAIVNSLAFADPADVTPGHLMLGERHVFRARIASEYAADLVIQNVDVGGQGGEHVSARLLEASEAEGDARTIEIVIPAEAPWGAIDAHVAVAVSGTPAGAAEAMTQSLSIRVVAELWKHLEPSAGALKLGQIAPGGSYGVSLRLTRDSAEPFVVRASMIDPPFDAPKVEVARVTEQGVNAWEITVSGSVGTYLGVVRTQLEVSTDVAGEERLIIPVEGVVHAGS